ncbi:SH3 domain-containing protein [Candidatus Synechococcus calcipolaris G9]|uniref:SH3 domain-containing protein n=1 Tax=Candidatus Synechococcus calcipolaris G9 TaxID=1497997 RepID=A0ABT6EZY5_9SYNE|nr:SH3 domain-containing protein [Candidatus Synechococcus calcipolaris]MDG2991174.1 SH3 domain-containing protein [Candidatus Synechococcus calcipolaris G9]
MKSSRILQWLLGTTLGLGLMVLLFASVLGIFSQGLLLPPERPEFTNDFPQAMAESPEATTEAGEDTEEPEPSPEPSPEPDNTTARVSYGEGLRIRDRPDRSGEPLGGVSFDEEVILLEQSDDGEWQRIRTQDGLEGWVLGFGLTSSP